MSASDILRRLETLEECDLFLLFACAAERISTLPEESLKDWVTVMAAQRPDDKDRDTVQFVHPCIEEFLRKIIDKKRLMF